MKQTRHNYFASVISNHKNNPKVLFSMIDHLINPDLINTEAQLLTLYVKNIQTTSRAKFY